MAIRGVVLCALFGTVALHMQTRGWPSWLVGAAAAVAMVNGVEGLAALARPRASLAAMERELVLTHVLTCVVTPLVLLPHFITDWASVGASAEQPGGSSSSSSVVVPMSPFSPTVVALLSAFLLIGSSTLCPLGFVHYCLHVSALLASFLSLQLWHGMAGERAPDDVATAALLLLGGVFSIASRAGHCTSARRAFHFRRVAVSLALDRAAQELEAAARLKAARSKLIRVVMHDLRSPLLAVANATALFGELPGETQLSQAEVVEMVQTLSVSSAIMQQIMADCLDFERCAQRQHAAGRPLPPRASRSLCACQASKRLSADPLPSALPCSRAPPPASGPCLPSLALASHRAGSTRASSSSPRRSSRSRSSGTRRAPPLARSPRAGGCSCVSSPSLRSSSG
jgi:hypothetical protein